MSQPAAVPIASRRCPAPLAPMRREQVAELLARYDGLAAYAAPEVLEGREGTARSDLASLGYVLIELLSGSPPFAGSWQQIVMKKMAKDAPSLASRWPDAPAPLVRLVARCLARDPAARPPTAEALLRELHALAAPPAPARSHGRLIAVASVVALAAIGTAWWASRIAASLDRGSRPTEHEAWVARNLVVPLDRLAQLERELG